MLKILNQFFTLLIWVGIWYIYDNVLARFSLSLNNKLLVSVSTVILSFVMIYVVNNGFYYKSTLYDKPNDNSELKINIV